MVKLKGFQKLTLTDQALQTWFNTLQIDKPKTVSVPLQEALGRILAKDLIAQEDLPRFDKSAVDGYAVRAADLVGASQFKPVILQLTQDQQVNTKQARQIWTGNPIPKGGDAVVMLENTKKRNTELEVWTQLAPGDNISKQGEDIQKGTIALRAGIRLNPYHLGLAAAQGCTQLTVTEKPKIAILATGNEIAELGTERSPNQIYDSNKTIIKAMLDELGAQTNDLGIAKDNTQEIAQKIQNALKTNDIIVTTGGTSVGGLDLVPDAINMLGKPGIVVHGVALRPAMPTALATLEGKPVLILSGNPVAAIVGFEVFGRPLICKMLGMPKEEPRPMVKATLTRRVTSALGRKTYVRVHVSLKNNEFVAEPVSTKGSGSISTMTQSNGYLIVPENREGISEGESVIVHMFSSLEDKTYV
ncbi:MAG: molybdopterin molybdotransferase MoeA [Candidatus Bathyarchaeota archaeon]|nr:molybdopterin molybdotransferase MoeA [Candidatus Bathyarchaeota archaeon]